MDKSNIMDIRNNIWESNTFFKDIFYQSPIGILLYNLEGKLIDANDSALNISGISKLDDILGTNIFDNPKLASKKNEILEKKLIKFQDTLDLIKINKQNIFIPSEKKLKNLEWTVSVTDSGYLVQIQDMSELKKSRSSQYQNEIRFQSIFENSLDAILLTNPDGTVLAANPAAEKMLDMTESEIMKAGREGIVVKDENTEDILKKRFQKGQIQADEKLRRKDGSTFHASVTSNLFTDIDGTLKTSMIIRDITRRKKAEIELKAIADKYRTILETANEGILVGDASGAITFANHKLANMLGYSIEEIIGTDARSYVDRDQIKKADGKFEERKIKTTDEYELKFIKKNGDPLWTIAKSSPIYDQEGNFINGVVMFTDITERKIADEKIKKLNRELSQRLEEQKLLFDLLPMSVCVTYNKDSKTMYANPTMEKLLGIAPGSNISQSVHEDEKPSFKSCLNGKELSPEELPVQKAISTGKVVRNYEYEIHREDGKIINFHGHATPLFDENGNVRGAIGAFDDITERKEIELKLNKNVENLARSNMELEQFAHIASHDLREPLRMITSFLQLLERRYADNLDEDAKEFIGYAVDGAKRLDAMINDILLYSKVSKERELSMVNFNKVIEKVYINLISSIEENDAEITYESLPTLKTDESLMNQVFQNLISNAIKYRGKEKPKIQISAEKKGDQYLFSVKDNGIGIDKKYIDKIFTIFQRLHTNEEHEGTGVGLSIVQKIIQQQGGQIWAESELGKGTTFYFTIPEN